MGKVRLQDVARDAGVSVATATRVIRQSGYVSDEKRQRVEASVVKLGYIIPAPQSRQPLPKAQIIGHLIRGTQTNLLFARLADSVNTIALSHGYHVITVTVDASYDAHRIIDTVNALRGYRAQGIIISSLGNAMDYSPMQSFLTNLTLPIVMVERIADLMGIHKVVLNAREGLFLATEHLLTHGHRRIAYMAPDWPVEVEQSRLRGYREAMRSCAGAWETFLPCNDYSMQTGYHTVEAYLRDNPLPTALIAADMLLSGAQQYLYAEGFRVPRDISLVGTDDTLAQYFAPPLTSLAFPEHDMARTAIEIILDAAQSPEMSPRTVLLSPRLKERGSVAPPRAL